MKIQIVRDIFGTTFTLGQVSIDFEDGKGFLPFGFSCEDVDRRVEEDLARKVKGQTAIPIGTYKMAWHTRPTGAVVPMLVDVPGFRSILLHPGNTSEDTEGCILVGMARDVKRGMVSRSKVANDWLVAALRKHGLGTCEVTRVDTALEITRI